MFGRALLALWWVPTIAVFLLVLHGWWAIASRDGEAFQRGGAALVVFGILVASLPYFPYGGRKFDDLVEKELPNSRSFLGSKSAPPISQLRGAARPRASLDLFAERYLGVLVILFGTAVNGYGDLLLKWLGWV